MTVNEMFTVVNEPYWKVLFPLYLFLISISAGSIMAASLSTVFGASAYRNFERPAAFVGFVALVLAPVMLILELAQPARFWFMINPANFNVTSPMSWGGLFLVLYGIAVLLFARRYFGSGYPAGKAAKEAAAASEKAVSKNLAIVLFLSALALSAYPGFELGVVKGKMLWRSELLPAYFIATTFLAGLGVMGLFARGAAPDTLRGLKNLMIVTILASLVFIIIRTLLLGTAGLEGSIAIKALWQSPAFYLGELVVGLLAPLGLLISVDLKKNQVSLTIASVLVLVGVFFMRYALVFTGMAAVLP